MHFRSIHSILSSTLSLLLVILHWNEPQRYSIPDLGAQLVIARPSRPWPNNRLRLRRIPSSKDHPRWIVPHIFHWVGHCTRISIHLPSHRSTNSDRIRVRCCSAGLLRPKRDSTSKMEARGTGRNQCGSVARCHLWSLVNRRTDEQRSRQWLEKILLDSICALGTYCSGNLLRLPTTKETHRSRSLDRDAKDLEARSHRLLSPNFWTCTSAHWAQPRRRLVRLEQRAYTRDSNPRCHYTCMFRTL